MIEGVVLQTLEFKVQSVRKVYVLTSNYVLSGTAFWAVSRHPLPPPPIRTVVV